MSYLENNPIKDFVADAITDKLDGLKGYNETHYPCDLAYELFEGENVDGVYFYDNYTAKKWINKNFEYIGEIAEEFKNNFDADYANKILLDIFDNPDRFVVCIVLEVASYLISRCETVDKLWNDEITLTDEIIDQLIKEIEALKNPTLTDILKNIYDDDIIEK